MIENSSHTTGDVNDETDGANNLGGLVGENNSSTIQNSYANGSVNGGDGANDRVGGLVGQSTDGATIENSYASGSVNGDAGDSDRVGGLVGFAVNSSGVTTAHIITNCYSTGDVDGGAGNTEQVGGLVGAEDSTDLITITNSYYNSDDSIGGGDRSMLGTGRTLAQLQTASHETPAVGPTTAADCTAAGGTLMTDNTCPLLYVNWTTDNWEFGDATQLPSIRRYTGDSTTDNLLCGQIAPQVPTPAEQEGCPSP